MTDNFKINFTKLRKFKSGKNKSGFTLIEILIVIAIFSFIGSIATIILVTSLRTSTKTNILNGVKENGNFAITEMTDTIRYARDVQCASSAPFTNITVTATDSSQIVFDCNNSTINENNISLIDGNSVSVVSCSITCPQQNFTANPVVQISFSLKQKNNSNLVEQIVSPIQFSTSVLVKNANR